jgi:DNA-directed RNA polymerase specialized sigma24 family protein
MREETQSELPASSARVFSTTHWSVVLQAGADESPQAAAALEQLCRTYWYPLYVFVRRRGYSREDAEDLTQQFFALVLEKDCFRLADPTRGRFRTFLLHALEHFLINEWKRAHRLKRGGGKAWFSLDADEAETRYLNEASETMTPERAYEKRWAMTLLAQVLAAMRKDYADEGKGRVFEELGELLWGKDTAVSYAQIGERLG